MAGIAGIRSSPSFRKWLTAVAAAAGVFILFGFFALPAILKPVIRDALAGALHRKTAVREVRVNPFSLSVAVLGLSISERDGPGTWISAEEIGADLEIASVFRGGPVLREVRVTGPYVNIVRRPDGSYNFSDLLEEFGKKPEKASKPLKYSFNNIRINDGRIDFLDGPKGVRHKVEGIQVSVPFLSNLKYAVDKYVQPSFAAVVNGDAVSLKGRSKPFHETMETAFDINVIDLSIPKYLEYLPFRREYEVPSAFLDVQAVVSFLQRKDGPPSISVDGYAELRKVRITGKDNSPMISLPSVRAVVSPTDIGAGEYRLASLTIRDPEIDVTVDRNRRLNLYALIPQKEKGTQARDNEADTRSPEGKGPQGNGKAGSVFSIDAVRLSGGKVRFTDASRPAGFRTVLDGIRVEADSFSTEKGKTASASIALSTDAGETLEMKGVYSLDPIGSEGTVSAGKLALGRYSPYYGDLVLFDVTRGTLDLRTEYTFARSEEGDRFLLNGLEAALNGLRLRQRGEKEDFLDIPAFTVKGTRIDPARREIVVGEVSTEKGRIAIRRDVDGKLNVARLVPGTGAGEARGSAPGEGGTAPGKRDAAEKPWSVTVKKASVDRYGVRFDDVSTTPDVSLSLDGIRLRAENATTEKGRKGAFSFSTGYGGKGKLSLGGSFSLDPILLAGRLKASRLPVGLLQPYWTDSVKVLVSDGDVSAEGAVRVSAQADGRLRAEYKGEASLNRFDSVDKTNGEEFLKFDTLHFGGIDVSWRPTNVAIREIALSNFYSRIIVHEDGSLNLQGIVGTGGDADNAAARKAAPAAEAKGAKEEGGPVPVRIDNVTLQGGDVYFSDRYIRPNYSASLSEIGGRVTGLSSSEEMLADVDLRGKLGAGTPLEITGKINPLVKDLFLDLKVDFRDIELSPFSPYSGRYAGYGIQKGKITLNLAYRIEKKKLDAQNKVFIDQFTFGDRVDSPDATKLPVKLAVSLLKDRKGEIRLDLPVSGRVDDPKFSVWKIIWKIVGNLLVKAATAPFALIGAMFGAGGEELAYLEFEPGSSAIPPAGAVKIGNLARALYERPALKLEIEGHADPERDSEALRQLLFRRKVAAQKVKALARAGQAVPAVDNVRVEAAEYPGYLALAYKEEKFPKPRNIFGMAKELPVPEMEKLMLANSRVAAGDLRQLAMDRAARVRDALVSEGRVEAGRVFVVEPKSLAPARKEKLKDSRVDFLIK
jgi:hypothetical protein